METKAGDPGAFAHFDLNRVPSPAFVVDEAAIRRNLAILADVKARSGAKVLCAMKAFSMWSLAPVIGEYLDGVSPLCNNSKPATGPRKDRFLEGTDRFICRNTTTAPHTYWDAEFPKLLIANELRFSEKRESFVSGFYSGRTSS